MFTSGNRRGTRKCSFESLEDRRLMAVVLGDSYFDTEVFGENIEGFLDGNVVGYAYVVNQDGEVGVVQGANGDARTAADGQKDFEVDSRLEVASVSKTVTAVAILKLLEDKGLSVDAKIWPCLPSAWQVDMGPNIESISFADVLKHRSGLTGAVAYDQLGQLIANGVSDSAYGSFSYSNTNYAMLRVLTGYLRSDVPLSGLEGDGVDAEAATGEAYKSYVQEFILEPMGIDADMVHTEAQPTMTYFFPDTGESGNLWGDYTEVGGAYGWKLSAEDLATFLDRIDDSDAILSQETIDLMRQEFLGFMDPDDWDTFGDGWFGTYYGHGGDFYGADGEVHTAIYTFPGGIQSAIVMNSGRGFSGHQNDRLEEAYENAWTDVAFAGTGANDVFEIRFNNSGAQDAVEIWMGSDGAAPELVFSHWVDTLYSLTINGLDGDDEFFVDQLPGSIDLILNGGGDDDRWEAAASSGNLELVNGITFHGGDGEDSAVFNDVNNPYTHPNSDLYAVGADQVHRTGGPPAAPFSVDTHMTGVEHTTLNTGNNGDWIEVLSSASTLVLNTGGGNDTISGGALYEDMAQIGGLVVNAGAGADKLSIDDAGNPYNYADSNKYLVTDSIVQRNSFAIAQTVEMNDVETLELTTGKQDDIVQVEGVPSMAFIHTRGGNDKVNVESLDNNSHLELFGNKGTDIFFLAGGSHDLDPVAGDVVVHGGDGYDQSQSTDSQSPQDDDQVYVFDDKNWAPGDFVVDLAGNPFIGHITKPWFATNPNEHLQFNLLYDEIERTYLHADDGKNSIDVKAAPWFNQLFVYAGGGDDDIDIHSTPYEGHVSIFAEGGNDVIDVSPTNMNLSYLSSRLEIYGGDEANDHDILNLRDNDSNFATSYSLTASEFTRASSGGVSYADIEDLSIRLGNGNSDLTILSTSPETSTIVFGNDGDDEVAISSADSPVTFIGGNDDDTARWVGSQLTDTFVVAGNTIYRGSGSLTTFDNVERRVIEGAAAEMVGVYKLQKDLLEIQGVEGVDESIHIRPTNVAATGWVYIEHSVPLYYNRVAEMAVEGNSGDADSLKVDGTTWYYNLNADGFADRFDINLSAQGTVSDPVLTLKNMADDEILGLRSYANLSGVVVDGLGGNDEFYVHALASAEASSKNISLYGGPGIDSLEVAHSPNAEVNHQPEVVLEAGDFDILLAPGDIDIQYGDYAYEVIYRNFEDVSLNEGPPLVPGDFDGAGAVENADLTLLLNYWGTVVPPTPASWLGNPLTAPAVDNDELTALLNNWGATTGAGSASTAADLQVWQDHLGQVIGFDSMAEEESTLELAAASISSSRPLIEPSVSEDSQLNESSQNLLQAPARIPVAAEEPAVAGRLGMAAPRRSLANASQQDVALLAWLSSTSRDRFQDSADVAQFRSARSTDALGFDGNPRARFAAFEMWDGAGRNHPAHLVS